jgi:hypothetical protein
MPASNTVEATLRSRYVDGITAGVAKTQAIMQSSFSAMMNAADFLRTAVAGGFESMGAHADAFSRRMLQSANDSGSGWSAAGFTIAGVAVLVGAAMVKMGTAAASTALSMAKQESETLELRLAFDSLAKTAGVDAAGALANLRKQTEGLVSTSALLRNSNRIMSAEIPLTMRQYEELAGSVFKLAKASGTDAVRAQDTLADALVKGNARGFQAIGVNLQVKDAMNELASAQGGVVSKMDADARYRAFITELSGKLSDAVQRNGADYFSLADAIEKTDKTFERWRENIGQGIGRSQVFSEMLKVWSTRLDEVDAKERGVNETAQATNGFLLATIPTVAGLARALAYLGYVLELVKGAFLILFNAGSAAVQGIALVVVGLTAAIAGIVAEVSKLAGLRFGVQFAKDAKDLSDLLQRSLVKTLGDLPKAFDGFGGGSSALFGWADGLDKMAVNLEKYRNGVVDAGAGTKTLGTDAAQAASEHRKLNDELKKFAELHREIQGRGASPGRRALIQLGDDFRKIDELERVSIEKRNKLKFDAIAAFQREMKNIRIQDLDEEARRNQELDRMGADRTRVDSEEFARQAAVFDAAGQARLKNEQQERTWTALVIKWAKERSEGRSKEIDSILDLAGALERQADMARRGRLGDLQASAGQRELPVHLERLRREIQLLRSQPMLSPQQLEQLDKLYDALDRLNRLNLSPFRQALQVTRDDVNNMGAEITSSFGEFWADLVSGQENAGKKFLAALLNVVANELMIRALRLTALAIERAAEFNFVGAAKAAAGAAAIAALGGVLKGTAANLANTSSAAGAQGSFQQNVPRPVGGEAVRVIDVGRPGGQQQQQQQPRELGVVRIEMAEGLVAREVDKNIRSNGKLRFAVRNA